MQLYRENIKFFLSKPFCVIALPNAHTQKNKLNMLQSITISPGDFMMPLLFSRNKSPLNFSAVMIRQLVPIKKNKNKNKIN
jgi:hypothetical protein